MDDRPCTRFFLEPEGRFIASTRLFVLTSLMTSRSPMSLSDLATRFRL